MGKPKAEPAAKTARAVGSDGLTAVRTTFNPHEVIRVGAAELLDLERQGLIHDEGNLAEPGEAEGETIASGVITDASADAGSTDDGKGPGA